MAELQLPAFLHSDLLMLMISQSVMAPEIIRTNVNVAGSIRVCLSAPRQSRELPAKAIIASNVRMKRRDNFTLGRMSRRQETKIEKSAVECEDAGDTPATTEAGSRSIYCRASAPLAGLADGRRSARP